jgi:hypothetical protein
MYYYYYYLILMYRFYIHWNLIDKEVAKNK